MSFQKVLQFFDLYKFKRFEDEWYTHSWHSYTFTFVAVFTLVFLVTGEIVSHFKPQTMTDLFIDESTADQLMVIDFDLVFERIPCHFIDISVSDITGAMTHNITKNIMRTRLDYKGRALGEQDEAATVDADELKDGVFDKEEAEYERILNDASFVADGHVEELHGKNAMSDFIKSHAKVRCS